MLAHFGKALRPLPKPLAVEKEARSDWVYRRQHVVKILNDERRRRHSARSRIAQADIDESSCMT